MAIIICGRTPYYFYLNSGQYWFVGADYNRENTRDLDNAYQRKNVRLGWVQEWPFGISSRLSVSYAKRTYKDVDLLGIRQKITNINQCHFMAS